MQVVHQQDHVTHAVIGGAKTIDFGISSSAEFFNILSSTLYKDQILAVVREVLCNGWDAHIEAGVQDKPVEITLTNEKFIIKDYGTGIHLDDMGVIYGTYGNSTKKNDGKQTGGFGLGCKAPFAYTDHFEVISCNDGIKTIYNLSKSSAQAQGKPGIVPIASFPTTDTGLQVSINIKNTTDARRFSELIKRIASNGDMNMTLNGKPIQKLNFDASKSPFFIVRSDDLLDVKHDIMVRYGNVVYPVENAPEIYADFRRISEHLEKLKDRTHFMNYRIIFQAPPHSISVQPNREGLSMQEHTVKTLAHLLSQFTKTLDTEFPKACDVIAEKIINKAVSDGEVAELLQREVRLPISKKSMVPTHINDVLSMAECYMGVNYPNKIGFRIKDVTMRLQKLVESTVLDRGLVQTYLRELKGLQGSADKSNYRVNVKTEWLQRQIIAPLMTKMLKAGLDTRRLYVFDPEDKNALNTGYREDRPPLVQATSASPHNLFNALPYLRNIVVLASSRTDLKARAYKHEVFEEFGKAPGFLFYHISMKKGARDEALKFFEVQDFLIVDLTVRQSWEPAHVSYSPRTPVPRKPVKKGLACLSSILQTSKTIDTRLSRLDAAPRIEKPEYVLLVPLNDDTRKTSLDRWSALNSRYIIELFGDRCGITTTSPMHTKWLQNGAKDFKDFLDTVILEEMMTNTRIQEFWAFNVERDEACNWDHSMNNLILASLRSKVLCAQFNLVCNLNDDDRKIMSLWAELIRKHYHNIPQPILDVTRALGAIPWSPHILALRKKLDKNPMLDILDQGGLMRILNKNVPTSKEHIAAIDILVSIINH